MKKQPVSLRKLLPIGIRFYTAPQPCSECEKLKAARDELAAHLIQTQQELFLTKGSLMVRDKQLEKANTQLTKLQDTLNETEAYCKRKDITIGVLLDKIKKLEERVEEIIDDYAWKEQNDLLDKYMND